MKHLQHEKFPTVLFENRKLYIPRASRNVPTHEWRKYAHPTPPEWQATALKKGFRIHCRLRDRLHIALECLDCGALTAQRAFTLRTAQPRCGACLERKRQARAKEAGLEFLQPDFAKERYGLYRAKCGHILSRQYGSVERVARGEVQISCEHCRLLREKAEARKRGWILRGLDPENNPNYRLYQHHCGHLQRVARANMIWGQLDCAACGAGWSAKPNYIYLFELIFENSFTCLKLGHSATPVKRYSHQLKLPKSTRVDVLKIVDFKTGRAARTTEYQLHAILRQRFPDHVIAHEEFKNLMNVKTEIYSPEIKEFILAKLNDIECNRAA